MSLYFLVPTTSQLFFVFSFYFHAIHFMSSIIKNKQFLVFISFESPQTFFLLYFHPLTDISSSQGWRVLICLVVLQADTALEQRQASALS